MPINPQSFSLPFHLASSVESRVREWSERENVRRLWNRDAALWTDSDESEWLGWLDAVPEALGRLDELGRFAGYVREKGFTHVLLLGMGGSSLCPEVLQSVFGRVESWPDLRVLDSTDPAQVRSHEAALDFKRTLLVVSSKSGTTLESSILFDHFFSRLSEVMSPIEAAGHSVAITDPDSPLEDLARERGLSYVFRGRPDIGGRFSALSSFGLVPAASMGLDVSKLLDRAREMVDACGPDEPAERNPGVLLGIMLGCLAEAGRDKMTLVLTPSLRGFGAWLDQLLAESTGKQGRGIIPVDKETREGPEAYGSDRFFVYLKDQSDEETDPHVDRLEEAGHPVLRIELGDAYGIAQEFFRWEVATAVAGSILGVNPFNQPDVESSKVAARSLTAEFEIRGSVSTADPVFEESGIQLFSNGNAFKDLQGKIQTASLAGYLGAYLSILEEGKYFAIQAYLEMNAVHESTLQRIRDVVGSRTRAATCLGFGPRFLHSSGQLHKGGPPTGVFFQITCADREDLPIPGRGYSFGVVKAAQAAGDMEVIEARGRPILRVHLGPDVADGLRRLHRAVTDGLAEVSRLRLL